MVGKKYREVSWSSIIVLKDLNSLVTFSHTKKVAFDVCLALDLKKKHAINYIYLVTSNTQEVSTGLESKVPSTN